jgi:proteasome lid subunit RPN8/RPN11
VEKQSGNNLMKWTALKPDIAICDEDDFLSLFNCATFIDILSGNDHFYVTSTARSSEKILTHLKTSTNELGGLLIGKVFKLSNNTKIVTHFSDCVPSVNFENSPVSLKMGAEVWHRATNLLKEKEAIVGWYHSHPNLGVFFSGTDRYNQKASFSSDFHVGLVVDPVRNEEALFHGENSIELPMKNYALVNGC